MGVLGAIHELETPEALGLGHQERSRGLGDSDSGYTEHHHLLQRIVEAGDGYRSPARILSRAATPRYQSAPFGFEVASSASTPPQRPPRARKTTSKPARSRHAHGEPKKFRENRFPVAAWKFRTMKIAINEESLARSPRVSDTPTAVSPIAMSVDQMRSYGIATCSRK